MEANINSKKQEDRRFDYSPLSRLNPLSYKQDPNRHGQYIHVFQQFGLQDIPYPVAIEGIPAIEDKLCATSTVSSFFGEEVYPRDPLYFSEKGHEKVIDLLIR